MPTPRITYQNFPGFLPRFSVEGNTHSDESQEEGEYLESRIMCMYICKSCSECSHRWKCGLTPTFYNTYVYKHCISVFKLPSIFFPPACRLNYSRSELLCFRSSKSSVSEPPGLPSFLLSTPPAIPPSVPTPLNKGPFVSGVRKVHVHE